MNDRLPTLKLTDAEWLSLTMAVVDAIGAETVRGVLESAIGPDRTRRLVDERQRERLSKDDNRRIIRELYQVAPGSTREEKTDWAISIGQDVFSSHERFVAVLSYVQDRVAAHEAAGGSMDAMPPPARIVDTAENRLVHPGRLIIWITPDEKAKKVYQRETGYFVPGEQAAYDFAGRAKDRWDTICSRVEMVSGDHSLRAGGPYVVAIYTEVTRWWRRKISATYADTGELAERVPDITLWRMVYPSGHTLRFEHRNADDHVGQPGSGRGDVLNPQGKVIDGWNFNKDFFQGKPISLRH